MDIFNKMTFEKMKKGIIGKPKFKVNDEVYSYINDVIFFGKVAIVDGYGTFEQDEEPSYDIMVEHYTNGQPCLIKHIRESSILRLKE